MPHHEQTDEALFVEISKLAHKLGWVAAFEDIEDEEDVQGIFIGNKNYILSLMKKLDTEYVLMEKVEHS